VSSHVPIETLRAGDRIKLPHCEPVVVEEVRELEDGHLKVFWYWDLGRARMRQRRHVWKRRVEEAVGRPSFRQLQVGQNGFDQNGFGHPASEPLTTITRGVGTAYIVARGEGKSRRFLVRYKLEGRASKIGHAGSFKRRSDAALRQQWVSGLLAAGRGNDIGKLIRGQEEQLLTVSEAGKRWLRSRIDISAHTRRIHGDSLRRLEGLIGERPIAELTATEIAEAVATIAEGHKPSTVRKSLNVLQQALDHAELVPNPARSPRIKLPKQARTTISPPETEHVEAVIRVLPSRYRLPVLALDSTGMRIGELCTLTWDDVDEPGGRWRVRPETSKTGVPRWIDPVDPDIHAAVCALCPREDRDGQAKVFTNLEDTRLRTAITRACRAAGVPSWSPHALRHRRISLLVLRGTPIPRVSAYVGHARGSMTLDTYGHVLLEPTELDYAALLP
jgi:integrase